MEKSVVRLVPETQLRDEKWPPFYGVEYRLPVRFLTKTNDRSYFRMQWLIRMLKYTNGYAIVTYYTRIRAWISLQGKGIPSEKHVFIWLQMLSHSLLNCLTLYHYWTVSSLYQHLLARLSKWCTCVLQNYVHYIICISAIHSVRNMLWFSKYDKIFPLLITLITKVNLSVHTHQKSTKYGIPKYAI